MVLNPFINWFLDDERYKGWGEESGVGSLGLGSLAGGEGFYGFRFGLGVNGFGVWQDWGFGGGFIVDKNWELCSVWLSLEVNLLFGLNSCE